MINLDLENLSESLEQQKIQKENYLKSREIIEPLNFSEIRSQLISHYFTRIIPILLFFSILSFFTYNVSLFFPIFFSLLFIVIALIYYLFLNSCINNNAFSKIDVFVVDSSLSSYVSFLSPFRSYDTVVKIIENEEFTEQITVKTPKRMDIKPNHFYRLYFAPYSGKLLFTKEIFF